MTTLEYRATGDLLALSSKLSVEMNDPQLHQEFLNRARSFAAAADATVSIYCINGTPSVHVPTIAFLLAQSIELALKAFALHKGYPFDKLGSVGIGHNIPRALSVAVDHGFSKPHAYDEYLFALLDKAYRFEQKDSKKLQYPTHHGFLTVPCLRALRELTEIILGEVFIELLDRSSYELARRPPVQDSFGLTIPNNSVYSGPSLADLRDKWQ